MWTGEWCVFHQGVMRLNVEPGVVCIVFSVFYQAEDGIRAAQESRGLGDVYKRQHLDGGRVQVVGGHGVDLVSRNVGQIGQAGGLQVLSLIHI